MQLIGLNSHKIVFHSNMLIAEEVVPPNEVYKNKWSWGLSIEQIRFAITRLCCKPFPGEAFLNHE